MSLSGVSVAPDCISQFNDLKLHKNKNRYMIFALSDNGKEIVIDEEGTEDDYEVFREKMTTKADQKYKGKIRPSYAVYDFKYTAGEGEGERQTLAFIAYADDDKTSTFRKMVHATSTEALKRALVGIQCEIQANDAEDLEWPSVITKVSKGKVTS